MLDRFGVVMAMLAGFANAAWLILENGPMPPLHRAQAAISVGLIGLAAIAVGLELRRLAHRRSSGLGVAASVFGLVFGLFVAAIVCCLRLPGSPV